MSLKQDRQGSLPQSSLTLRGESQKMSTNNLPDGMLDAETSSKRLDDLGESWVFHADMPTWLTCKKRASAEEVSEERARLVEEGSGRAVEYGSVQYDNDGKIVSVASKMDGPMTFDEFHDKCDKIVERTDYSGDTFKLSMFGGISNLVAGIIGAGVLSMPLALQFSGVLVGSILILLVAVLSHFGGYYLGMAGRMTGKRNISEIAYASLGNWGTVLTCYSMLGLTLMAAIAYVVLWYLLMASSLKFFGVDGPIVEKGMGSVSFASLRTGVMSGMVLLISPVCCLNSMEKLSFTSMASVVIFAGLVIVVIVEYFRSYKALPIEQQIDNNFEYKITNGTITSADYNHPCFGFYDYQHNPIYSGKPLQMMFTISLVGTAFLCHFGCVDVFCKEMKKPTLGRQNIVMGTTILVAVVFYGLFALFGWDFARGFRVFANSGLAGTCKQGAQNVFSDNLVRGVVMGTANENAVLIVQAVLSFFIIGVLFLTYPQFIFGARMCILGMAWKKKDEDGKPVPIPNWVSIVTSLSLVLFTLIVAIVFPKVLSVLAYAGCGPGAALVYILPPAMILSLNRNVSWTHHHKWIPLIMIIIGCFFSISGFVTIAMFGDQLDNGANRSLDKELANATVLDAQGDEFKGTSVRYFFDYDQRDYNLENSFIEVTALERSLLYQMRTAAQQTPGTKGAVELTVGMTRAQVEEAIFKPVKSRQEKQEEAQAKFDALKTKIDNWVPSTKNHSQATLYKNNNEAWKKILQSLGQNVIDAWNAGAP